MARQLNLDEMCTITGFKPTFMRQWCSRADTPAYKFGRRWRCDEWELEEYLLALRDQPPEPVKPQRRARYQPPRDPGDWGLAYVHGSGGEAGA